MGEEEAGDVDATVGGSPRSVRIVVGAGDDARLRSAASRRLAAAIAAAAAVDVRPDEVESPAGSKSGTALQIGSLVVSGTLSAGVLATLARIACAFVERGDSRRIELEAGGDRLVIESASVATERAVVADWLRRRAAADPAGEPAVEPAADPAAEPDGTE